MQTLTVELEDRSYPISIGAGLLRQQSLLQAAVPANDILLVSNTTVAPLYAKTVTSALADRRVVEVILPDGEQHKSLSTAGRVFDVLVANRFGRDALVLALGGGVVGDLAGFVAACYQRGIDFVQMPTTLLAQVDSSVGGKTGGQSSRRQEPDRLLPPAARSARRYRRAGHLARARVPGRDSPRSSSTG